MKVLKSSFISQSNKLIKSLKEKDLLLFLNQGRLARALNGVPEKTCNQFSNAIYIDECNLVNSNSIIHVITDYPIVCQRTGKTTYYLRYGTLENNESICLWWADTLGGFRGNIEIE